jgi:uncharacterized membrane protein (DUF373 family)
MFIWTMQDVIFFSLLGFALVLFVLAWLIYWIRRLIELAALLGRRVRAAWQKFAFRFSYVWGN